MHCATSIRRWFIWSDFWFVLMGDSIRGEDGTIIGYLAKMSRANFLTMKTRFSLWSFLIFRFMFAEDYIIGNMELLLPNWWTISSTKAFLSNLLFVFSTLCKCNRRLEYREDGSAIGFLAKMFFLSFCIFSFLKIAFGEWKIDLSLAISLIELFFLKEGALYSLNETSWNWI